MVVCFWKSVVFYTLITLPAWRLSAGCVLLEECCVLHPHHSLPAWSSTSILGSETQLVVWHFVSHDVVLSLRVNYEPLLVTTLSLETGQRVL